MDCCIRGLQTSTCKLFRPIRSEHARTLPRPVDFLNKAQKQSSCTKRRQSSLHVAAATPPEPADDMNGLRPASEVTGPETNAQVHTYAISSSISIPRSAILIGVELQASSEEERFHSQAYPLAIMPLSKVKLPQETISLQLFEPRYRALFKIVKQSSSRRFGLVLADQQECMMESIGCLCELTHYIPVPERRRILVIARAVGRFETKHMIHDKPFITAMVQDYADKPPNTFQEAASISQAAFQLWQCMQQVKELAGKLYSHLGPIDNEVYSNEVQRWCPDKQFFADSQHQLPSGQADVIEILTQAGLLGSADTAHDRLTEFLPDQSMEDVTEAQRHERFSFAVAHALELPEEQLQEMLCFQSTAMRLTALYDALADGRSYLAARSTLRDTF